jgi:integrase
MPAAPETVMIYLTELSVQAKASTLARRVATISQAHEAAGMKGPDVRLFLRALRREKADQGSFEQGKRAISGPELRAMLRAIPETPLGVRDRALLLVGFLGAFRRSELVGLDVEHTEVTEAGLVVHIRRSKTDPEGKGEKRGIPRSTDGEVCPVQALKRWLETAGIRQGPLFRSVTKSGQVWNDRLSDRAVARAVKRYAAAAQLNPAEVAGHSLRAGLATAAAMAGKSERAIMQQTGHKSVTTVRRYIRDGNLFRENAADGLL